MGNLNTKMTALADEIRELSGTNTTKSIDAMTTDVGAANTEISEQMELISQISTALEGKAAGGGVTLPELTNPASTSDILSGKEAIDGEGNIITGTIATKTSNDITAVGATVIVPAGYYASQNDKTVALAPQATPTITVSSSGLITASATQSAGYIIAGTETATKQLTTQAAKTITPTTSSQTAVASGRYTTGAITVAAIPSNYEDVGTETTAYTTKISQLETAVAALESELEGKASGGSGGANIETCTVNFNNLTYNYVAQIINDNIIQIDYQKNVTNTTIENVMKGSILYIDCGNFTTTGVIASSTANAILINTSIALYQINGDCTFSPNEASFPGQ